MLRHKGFWFEGSKPGVAKMGSSCYIGLLDKVFVVGRSVTIYE